MKTYWERIRRVVRKIPLTIAILPLYFGLASFLPLGPSGVTQSGGTPQLPGIFEGQGAVTLGCALWDVPYVGEEWPGDAADFQAIADRDSLLLFFVHDGKLGYVSGQRCGISIDHRRFPEQERRHD